MLVLCLADLTLISMKTIPLLLNHGDEVCPIDQIDWFKPAVGGWENRCILHTQSQVCLGLDDEFSIACDDGVKREAHITRSGVDVFGWKSLASVLF